MVKKNIKAISPVAATALLLVVAVIAVVGFQTWFNTYQSGLNAKVEQQSNTGANIVVERLENGTVYLRNAGTDSVTVNEIKVTDSKGKLIKDCTNNGAGFTLPESKVTGILLNSTNCAIHNTSIQGTTADVVVISDKGVYSATEIVR